jgi:hypothetical protein
MTRRISYVVRGAPSATADLGGSALRCVAIHIREQNLVTGSGELSRDLQTNPSTCSCDDGC